MDTLTRAARILRDEIERSGPIPFSRFMQTALYHPEHGYYRRERDPFGMHGDFYTAEQLQPVFGRLIASELRSLCAGRSVQVVELGAGRREMAEAFADFHYIPVDIGYGAMPSGFEGVVFSNELFDALPVDLLARRDDAWVERRVGFADGEFMWVDGQRTAAPDVPEEVAVYETQEYRLRELERIAERLQRGWVLTIDYGYTRRELLRFPEGTLMSYRRHKAAPEVLRTPGEQDITAHVDFTALREHGERMGLRTERFETLASMLLRAGERDNFAAALAAGSDADSLRNRGQLKSLLFGMGEVFRVLLQRRD